MSAPPPAANAAAVLVAAGASTRMSQEGSAKRKPLLPLGGQTVLEHACAAFHEARLVRDLIVVTHAEDLAEVTQLARESAAMKSVLRVLPGGATRTHSTRIGLEATPEDAEVVLVHDAARPLIRSETIDRCVAMAQERGAALVGVPVVDTIKTSSDGYYAERTLDRSVLWRAQTPQAFRRRTLEDLMQRALGSTEEFTDEASVHERFLGPVPLVKGTEDNFKLTTPRDLDLAAALLDLRKKTNR